jgi:hypothetical protein
MQGEAVLQGEVVSAEAPPQQYAQPVYSQPAPVAMPPAAPQTVQIQVLPGMAPGSVLNVQANGHMIVVTVPAGCKPGQLLSVAVPPPPALAIQQPVAVMQ